MSGELEHGKALEITLNIKEEDEDERPQNSNGISDIKNYLQIFNNEIQSNPSNEDEGSSVPREDSSEKQGSGEIVSGNEAGNVVLGTEAYHSVTLVPTEGDSSEQSFLLIFQPPKNDNDESKMDDEEQDATVYDFEDVEDPINTEGAEDVVEEGEVRRTRAKTVQVVTRKCRTMTKTHMCNFCNYSTPKRYLLSRHMKSHSEERPHKCSVCDRGFKTLASLQNHVNTHTGTKPHQCKFCPSAFTTSGELVRHIRYKHTHEKPHKCSLCDYASVELSKMRNHMRCHTGERPYQCPHCTYASPDSFKLKRHLRIHTGEKPYQCDVCNSRFTQSNSLKAHKLIHNGSDKPVFRCDLCPATCGRKTDLRIHVQKLHTSGKLLSCKRCGKSFPDRYNFKLHSKTHEGEKCWKCDLCPYASVSHRHLESHMLVHTDQKPFKCDMCDQSFRQKQLLRRHQNLYHDPNYVAPLPKEKTHECSDCKRAFRHKGNLIRHMSVHDPKSTATDDAAMLKVGRQKRIQLVNGQKLEITPARGNVADNKSAIQKEVLGNSILIDGNNGQQYMVLEVIRLNGADGQPTINVLSDSNLTNQITETAIANMAALNSFVETQVETQEQKIENNDETMDSADTELNDGELNTELPNEYEDDVDTNETENEGKKVINVNIVQNDDEEQPIDIDTLSNSGEKIIIINAEEEDQTFINENQNENGRRIIHVNAPDNDDYEISNIGKGHQDGKKIIEVITLENEDDTVSNGNKVVEGQKVIEVITLENDEVTTRNDVNDCFGFDDTDEVETL